MNYSRPSNGSDYHSHSMDGSDLDHHQHHSHELHHHQCDQTLFHCAPAASTTTVTVQPYGSQSAASTCGPSNQSLDTVRSLHQTVVSLRNALDDARREISTLKKQMNVQTVIEEGRAFKEKEQKEDTPTRREEPPTESAGKKLGNQIDVKIRVSSNVNVSTGDGMEEGRAPSGGDSSRSVVNIKLTSQENLNVTQREDSVYSFNQETNEHVVLETRDSEPLEEHDDGEEEGEESQDPLVEEEPSDGDSVFDDSKGKLEGEPEKKLPRYVLQIPHQKLTRAHSDTQEEVDDIELIFSSEDAKELHEEEMVSISTSFEPWQKPGASGTPVLLSFEKFSLDEDRPSSSGQRKQVSLDETAEGHKNRDSQLAKKTSLDRSIEEEELQPSLGHSKWKNQKKELHVTDISKCGISEENIMDMGRRNTCPNPPVYRPILTYQRDPFSTPPGMRTRTSLSGNRCVLGGKFNRPGGFTRNGSLLNSTTSRAGLRSPLIAITNAGGSENDSKEPQGAHGPKRSSSVQTDISALTDHWQSESHLAGGGYGNGLFTLPSKFNPLLSGGSAQKHRAPLR